MTDITKLPDLWRISKALDDGSYLDGYAQASNDSARELTAALPKWTKAIRGESSTYPEPDQKVMRYFCGSHEITSSECEVTSGDWWRHLCDLDYPPGEQP